MKALSAKEAARFSAERSLAKGSAKSGLSSPSTAEKNGRRKGLTGMRRVQGERPVPYEKTRQDGSRISECREQDNAISFARRTESSSEIESSRRMHGRVV